MGCFKIDKLDKIVISFTLIIVTMFSIFNCFCYASENVDFTIVPNLTISNDNSNVFVENKYFTAAYVQMEQGYSYTVTIPEHWADSRNIVLSETVPNVGVHYDPLAIIEPGSSYTYNNKNEDTILYLDIISGHTGLIITRKKLPSYKNTINMLTNIVTPLNFWNVFENIIPYISVVVLFSLGIWFIKHNIIEHSKGREY